MSEESRARRQERRHKRREKLLDMLGNKCVWCGATDNLTFDHIDKSTKSFVLSGRGLDGKWENILQELDKTQILCDTSHKTEHRNFCHGVHR